jgi:hypothetical protein
VKIAFLNELWIDADLEDFDPDLKIIIESYLVTYDILNFWDHDFQLGLIQDGATKQAFTQGVV